MKVTQIRRGQLFPIKKAFTAVLFGDIIVIVPFLSNYFVGNIEMV